MKQEGINNNEGCTTLAGILDCFGRASLAMTRAWGMTGNECLTTNDTVSSLRGTKQYRIMKQEGINNNEGCTTLADILDCFSRASLAMTAGGNVPSLRGTKKSRRMKHEETYNNEGCTTLADILDCFSHSSFAMTETRNIIAITMGKYRNVACRVSTMTAYQKNNCQLNKNHSQSFNQTNHSPDNMNYQLVKHI
jgi:hypothetical protein